MAFPSIPWLATTKIPFHLSCDTFLHLVAIEKTEFGIKEKSQGTEDYELCITSHKMEKLGLDLDDESNNQLILTS